MSRKLGVYNSVRCGKGQDIYSAVGQAVKDGIFPQGSKVGQRRPRHWSEKDAPSNVVGSVTVRQGEGFWVVK